MPSSHLLKASAALVVVTGVCALFVLERPAELFIYDRTAFLSGEYWRLVSGHFVHKTWAHLLLNLAAWWLIWAYGRPVCGNGMWALLLFVCALGTGVGMFVFLPELEWYTGLSGVLHGLFFAVAILRLSVQRNDHPAWFILAVITVKLAYEHFQGPTPVTAGLVDLPVIFEAHWYGAVSGVSAAVLIGLARFARRPQAGIGRA